MLLILSFYIGLGGDYVVLKGEDVGRGEGYGYVLETGLMPVKGVISGIGYRNLDADFSDTTFSLNGFYIFYRYDFNPLKKLTIHTRLEGGVFNWNMNKDGDVLKIITITGPMQVDTVEVEGKTPGVGGGLGFSYSINRFSIGVFGGIIYLTNADRDKFGMEDNNEWFYEGGVKFGVSF